MIVLSKTTTSVIKKAMRMVTAVVFGKVDARESVEAGPYGWDSCPIPGAVAVYMDTASMGDNVIMGYVGKNQIAQPGESRMYSTDTNGALKYFVYVKADQILIGTGTPANHMTQYEGLQTAFDSLKTSVSDLTTAFNAHVHASNGAAPTPVPGVIPATAPTADISGAKLDNILTN